MASTPLMKKSETIQDFIRELRDEKKGPSPPSSSSIFIEPMSTKSPSLPFAVVDGLEPFLEQW
jgi:hypothetical protein